jgi:hypothetical protein
VAKSQDRSSLSLTDVDGVDGDHGGVSLVCDTVMDLLEVVRVGDELVIGPDILRSGRSISHPLRISICLLPILFGEGQGRRLEAG